MSWQFFLCTMSWQLSGNHYLLPAFPSANLSSESFDIQDRYNTADDALQDGD